MTWKPRPTKACHYHLQIIHHHKKIPLQSVTILFLISTISNLVIRSVRVIPFFYLCTPWQRIKNYNVCVRMLIRALRTVELKTLSLPRRHGPMWYNTIVSRVPYLAWWLCVICMYHLSPLVPPFFFAMQKSVIACNWETTHAFSTI